jgi:hypothetical protein
MAAIIISEHAVLVGRIGEIIVQMRDVEIMTGLRN